ncbi:hypothetical protein [Clostridium sp.]|jgi:hypothetical protein|uniref:glycine-rich domain-containing protein n=1 Tax=Clostridium sp. TaxID=1506 RepID=UPI003EEAA4E5
MANEIYIADKVTLDLVKEDTASILGSVSPTITIFESAGQYEFLVPSGVSAIYVTSVGSGGGGGAGGGVTDIDRHGAGGIGGSLPSIGNYKNMILVSPGETIQIEIGEGGVGGAPVAGDDGEDGLSGGVTSFGSYFSISGGSGGNGGNADRSTIATYSGTGHIAEINKPTVLDNFYVGLASISIPGAPGDMSNSYEALPSIGYGTPGSGGGGHYKTHYSTPLAGGKGADGRSGLIIIEEVG